jgi:tellurite resistance protein TerC
VLAQITIWHWVLFGVVVAFLLALDLTVFHRKDHAPSMVESIGWSIFWVALALLFNGAIWWWLGDEAGIRFLAGYLVEKSLSVDNLFVFLVIFRFFQVPLKYQYRVLFWGILGAVFMRLAFILAGTELIERFHWMNFLFGVFLLYTALKLFMHSGAEVDPEKNIVLRVARRVLPVSRGNHHEHGSHFFVREEGHFRITPMLLVLLVIESTDVVFAVDSVPAIIGITRDRFLVFTSNIFAILGLRALYFVLAGVMELFRYLHFGLAAVLGFIGLKMAGEYVADVMHWKEHGADLVSPWTSLGVVAVLLTVSIVASILAGRREAARGELIAKGVHRIRLRKPWCCEVTNQGFLWRRKFGRPTGIEPAETVWICFEGLPSGCELTLNAEPLGLASTAQPRTEFNLTGILLARNEVEIRLPPDGTRTAGTESPPFDVYLEIRESSNLVVG